MTQSADAIKNHPLFTGATTVGLMSGEKPMFPSSIPGEHGALKLALQSMGLRYQETEGRYGAPEKSVIVYGPTRDQLFDLGQKFGQESVIYSERGKHELLYTNGPKIGKANPSLPKYDYFPKNAPEDYYTRVPETGGYLRLYFDDSNLQDTPVRHRAMQQAQPVQVVQSANDMQTVAKAMMEKIRDTLAKSDLVGLRRPHPHAYDWHDGHTTHHPRVAAPGAILEASLAKADASHPHMDGSPPPHPTNAEFAGVGASTYAKYAAPFGQIHGPHKPTNLMLYPLHGKLPEIDRMVNDHGYQVYYAGGKYGRPDLATRNYNTKHLMVYDPSPDSGASFGQEDYTKAWRHSHELAHALAYPQLNEMYGEGRRIGKMGVHRSLREAQRAVHWEWLAAHKQRELLSNVGVNIPDDVFHRELNTVMHDAVHRAVTGKFTEPSSEGFEPHSHKVPLEVSLGLLREAARNLGLRGDNDLLTKSEGRTTVAVDKNYTMPEVAAELRKTLQTKVAELEKHYTELRARELRKSDKCTKCGKTHALEKCGEMMPTKKAEMDGDETVPAARSAPNASAKGAVLPGSKKSKVIESSESDPKPGKSLSKDDVPMAKPGSPKVTPVKKDETMRTSRGNRQAMAPAAPAAASPAPATATPAPAAPAPAVSPMAAPSTGRTATGHRIAKNAPNLPGYRDLSKAQPRLGGRDATSQMMTQHAMASAPVTAAPAAAPAGPKLTPDDQARRAAELASFTPAGAFGEPKGQGAVAGAMTRPDPGQLPGLTPPPAAGAPAKPMGTQAAGPLDRFRAALHGANRPQIPGAQLGKSQK